MPVANNNIKISNYARKPRGNLSLTANSQNQLGGRPVYSWRQFQDQKIEREMKELELERLRELLDVERRRNYAEQEERQRALDDRFARETNWRRLMQKAALANKVGKYGAGWTWGDDAWADRLGVEMGYLKPWNRTYQVKAGR